jgi:hypothetical protein
MEIYNLKGGPVFGGLTNLSVNQLSEFYILKNNFTTYLLRLILFYI